MLTRCKNTHVRFQNKIRSVSTDRTMSKDIERAGTMHMDVEHRKLKV